MIKWKKRIMMMLVVCIMATMPSAIAEAQVFNLKSTPTDYYSYHDIKDYMVINKSRMYYHLLNDKPVFCVESGYKIRGANGEEFVANKTNNLNIDFDVERYMDDSSVQSKIAYLGFYSKDKPHLKDYMFTQMMIWQSLPEHAANGKDSKGNYRSYFSDKKIEADFKAWKESIEKQISNWNKQPKFETDEPEIVAGETANLKDLENVLKEYGDFEYTKEGVTVSHLRGDNFIEVKADDNCKGGKVEITESELKEAGIVKYTAVNEENNYFVAPWSQDMAVFGNVSSESFSLTFNVIPTSRIKVIKRGETLGVETLLAGSVFEVRTDDGEVITELVTDHNGEAITGKLLPGKYFIKEIKAPKGYVPSKEIVEINVNGSDVVKEIYNPHQKISFSIMKLVEKFPYWDITSEEVLAEVSYGLFTCEVEGMLPDTMVEKLYPEENGILSYTGLLPEGEYYIKELSTHEQYYIDPTKYYFEVQYDESGEEIILVEINGGNSLFNEFIRVEPVNEVPKTGDVNNPIYVLCALGAAAIGLLCLGFAKNGKNKV